MLRLSFCALSVLTLVACGGDPTITSVTATPATVAAGGVVNLVVVVDNVEFGEVSSELTVRGLRAAHGDEAGYHLHTYLDDTDSNPLLQIASASYPVTIPLGTAVGGHQLIVRLHGADHTIYTPEVKQSAAITVQ